MIDLSVNATSTSDMLRQLSDPSDEAKLPIHLPHAFEEAVDSQTTSRRPNDGDRATSGATSGIGSSVTSQLEQQ